MIFLVQGKERALTGSFWMPRRWSGTCAGGGMFAFLAAHRGELFADRDVRGLVPLGEGRPSIPQARMAAIVTGLQVLHDHSDPEAAEAARCDLRWKAACGLALDHAGFDPPTLVYWRRRLAASDRPHRINDAVPKVIKETGVLTGRRRRAVNSTILADAVATQDTDHPAGRCCPPGDAGGTGRGGAGRGGVHRPRLRQARQAEDRLG